MRLVFWMPRYSSGTKKVYNSSMSDFNTAFEKLLDQYVSGPARLKQALSALPAPVLDFRPAIPGAWTVSEHVRHLVDNDFNFVLRAKMSIAEPGARVMLLDEEAWAKEVYRYEEDLQDYLDLFERTRGVFGKFLQSVERQTLQQAWVDHPKRGHLSFIDLFQIYAGHVDFHLEYLERNLAAWKKDHP